MMKEIVCNNLSYSIDTKQILSSLSFSLAQSKIGLVGSNGVGKTTLIRLLVGQLEPTSGSISVHGTIGYMPQDCSSYGHGSIATVLGVEQKLRAIEAISKGHGALNDFDTVGEDWGMRERILKIMNQVDLGYLLVTRNFTTLSGGEKTRVLFAKLLLNCPDFLVLDEPTNNMDACSRTALYSLINEFKGGILVVSHDRQLLNFMHQIAELSTLGLKLYGGNFDDYKQQKQIEQSALEADIIDAQKQLIKTKRVVQQSKEKFDKRASMGSKKRREGSQPKILLDYHKERAETTKSKLEAQSDKQLSAAQQKLNTAKVKLEQKHHLDFDVEATRVPNGKIVLDLQHVCFDYPNGRQIISELDLTIVGPQHIAICGDNGSGKSTLMKLIMKQLEPTSGSVAVGVEQVAYLDQNLSILDHNQNIVTNFNRLNRTILESDCRTRLATFLFTHEMVDKPMSSLSGGEKMRAAMACIFMGKPPQLILLDEPTNNMDLERIQALESALSNYKGALLVVSHDKQFFENIGIGSYVQIHAQRNKNF